MSEDVPVATSRRRSRRVISRDEIYEAAVAVVDAEGLAALSMRRLAEETGVGVMTLYGFVANKDELVAGLGAHVLRGVEVPSGADVPWREQLIEELRILRSAIREHPGLLELLSVGNDHAPILDGVRERLVGILRGAGLDDRTAVEGLGGLTALTLGFAVGSRLRGPGVLDATHERLSGLPDEDFPHLRAVAAEYADHWSDSAFESSVRALLDGMESTRGRRP